MSEIYEKYKVGNERFFVAFIAILFASLTVVAQDLPKEIRGYKVYEAKISVKNQDERKDEKSAKKDESEAFVKVGEPKLTDVSLTGITFELSAEIDSLEQSGTIDFLTFQDFRVNGLSVEIEEYQKSFEFKRGEKVVLPSPVKIFVGTGQTLRGALSEWRDSKKRMDGDRARFRLRTIQESRFQIQARRAGRDKFENQKSAAENLKASAPLKPIFFLRELSDCLIELSAFVEQRK